MDRETSKWLQGKVSAIRSLTESVRDVVQLHDTQAAKDLNEIRFICNRAERRLEDAADEKTKTKGR